MTKKLTAILVIIGNEILSGRTQDTNTSWIASRLAERGIRMSEARVIPDVEDVIIQTINELRGKADYVFTTGGIGPTHDDITTESIAKAFGVKAVLNQNAWDDLLRYYGSADQLTPARLKMAHIPEGATLINNPVSGAPGYNIGNVFVMAGVPRIMQAMLDEILPRLDKSEPILSNTVSCDLLESMIAEDLAAIQAKYPTVDVGSYPHFRMGDLGLSLVLRSSDNDALHAATDDVVAMVKKFGHEPRAISIKSVAPR